MGLSQSDTIFGAILIGFIVYITVRGQLPEYLDVFNHAPRAAQQSGGGSGSGNAIGDQVSKGLNDFVQNQVTDALSSVFGI